jgi:hypothetical protein
MIRRALRSYVLRWEKDQTVQRERALRSYDNLAKCSCWMCGNPRRLEGKITLQERRLAQGALDEVEAR